MYVYNTHILYRYIHRVNIFLLGYKCRTQCDVYLQQKKKKKNTHAFSLNTADDEMRVKRQLNSSSPLLRFNSTSLRLVPSFFCLVPLLLCVSCVYGVKMTCFDYINTNVLLVFLAFYTFLYTNPMKFNP